MAHSSNGRELQQQLENARQEIERLRLVNEQQRFNQAIAATERKFEEQLAEMRQQFKDQITIDTKNYQENMKVMKQSTEENKFEARRQLEREREDRVAAERNFQEQLAEVGQQMAREREDAVRKIEAQLAEKGETIDGIRQYFEAQIEALQRRFEEQSGENRRFAVKILWAIPIIIAVHVIPFYVRNKRK